MSANSEHPETAELRRLIRAAMERATHNVDLHIEREVFHEGTAKAVVQEFEEQLKPLLEEKGEG
jgi:hypothetical protein